MLACLALIALVALQVSARSEALVRRPLAQRLDGVAVALNGRISVREIAPAGLWGTRLVGVEFRPHTVAPLAGDRPLLVIDSILVEPRLGALVAGRLELATVRIEGPAFSAVVDSDGGPHADWFRWLTHEVRGPGSPDRPAAERQAEARPPGRAVQQLIDTLPRIEVRGGFASFDDPSGRLPSFGARIDDIVYSPASELGPATIAGDVRIEGLGRGAISSRLVDGQRRLSLRLLDQNDVFPLLPFEVDAAPDAQLAVESVHVDWPPSVALTGVRASGLRAPLAGMTRAPLDVIEAAELTVSANSERVRLDARRVELIFADGRRFGVARSRVDRSWDGPVGGQLDLTDLQGRRASVTLVDSGRPGAGVRIRVDADDYGFGPALALAGRLPARVLDGDFTGVALGEWAPDDASLGLRVDGRIDALAIDAPLLSAEPIRELGFEFDAEGTVWIGRGDVLLERARVLVDDLDLFAEASGSRSELGSTLELDITLPRQPAARLLEALPAGIAETLAGMEAEGELGASARFSFDSRDLEATELAFAVDAESFHVRRFGPLAPIDRLAEPDFVWTVQTFDGADRRVGPGEAGWIRLDDLSPLTYRAIVAAEDDRFWEHTGFDPRGIRAALLANLEAGQVVRGGSTISQQVVKNLFLGHDRTLARKLQEAFLTWQLERHADKRTILEYYVNLAHWGPHVYGLRDAAMAYFDHVPSQLTLRESVFLAAILPNPTLFGGQYTQGVIPPSRRQKMTNVLNNLHRAGYLSAATLQYHAGLIAQGDVSNTPPPRLLGDHDAPTRVAGIDRLGSEFFQ